MKKHILSLLFTILSIAAFSQSGSQAVSGIKYRVNDTTTYQSAAATAHAQGYADIYWNNQASTPHFDIWNGSAYEHVFVFGGNSGTVESVSGTTNRVDVDNTDPANPIVNISSTFEALLSKVAQRIDQNNASTTSAQLATTLSDEEGSSGGFVRKDYVDAAIATVTNLITIVTIPEVSVSTGSSPITLDFSVSSVARQEVFFRGSSSFSSPRTISVSNTTNARKFSFEVDITNVAAVLTFTGADSADDPWDESADTWTPPFIGKYTVHAEKINSVWSISGWGPRL